MNSYKVMASNRSEVFFTALIQSQNFAEAAEKCIEMAAEAHPEQDAKIINPAVTGRRTQ